MELDLNFEDQLEAKLSSRELPGRIQEALKQDRQQRTIKCKKKRRVIKQLSRAVLTWLCDFHRINLLVSFDETPRKQQHWTVAQKLARFWSDKPKWARKRWPYLLALLYIWCDLFLCVSLYYQYQYDVNSIRLSKFQSLMNDSRTRAQLLHSTRIKLPPEEFQSELARNIKAARAQLKSIGSAFLEWPFINECIVLYFMILTNLFWTLYPMCYHFSDMVFITQRAILSKRDECHFRAQLTLSEMRKFIRFSLLAAEAKLERWQQTDLTNAINGRTLVMTYTPTSHLELIRLTRRRALDVVARKLARQHQWVVEQLKVLALDGWLSPLNRSARWRDILALSTLAGTTTLAVYIFTVPNLLHIWLANHFAARGRRLELDGIKDLHACVVHFLPLIACTISTTFVNLINLLTLSDALEALRGLSALLRHIVAENEKRLLWLAQLRRGRRSMIMISKKSQLLAKSIERDLLTAIMQIRLFRREFQLSRVSIAAYAFWLFFGSFSMPVIVRLHNPYFLSELRKPSLNSGIVISVSCTVFLMPVVILTSRCQDVSKLLWSLAAQMARFEGSQELNKHLDNENVTILSLRRELANSKQTMRIFTYRLLGTNITFGKLIKVLFWLFVIIFSLLDSTNSLLDDSLAGYLNDPFGLFKFV